MQLIALNITETVEQLTNILCKQLWGNPEDFKGATVFLASAASDYVHGTIVTIDGGWMGR